MTEVVVRAARPPAVTAVARAMVERVDELAARATQSMVDSIPTYRAHRDELERSVRHTMRTFLDYGVSGVAPSELELARLRDVGRRRAEAGIPLSDVLHAFRVAARTLLSGVQEGSDKLGADAVLWFAEALFAYIDVVSTLVTNRYVESQADLLRGQEVRRREFLSDLLHGHRTGAEAVAEAASLGIELLGESRVLVIGRPDAGDELADDAEPTVEDVVAPTPVLLVRIGGDLVVLPLGPAGADAIADRLGDVLVGEGRIHPGLDGIRQSYAEGRDALAIARATGGGPVARFSGLVLDRLLRQDPALLAEFVGLTIGVVQAYDARRHTDLLHTLAVWAEEGGSPRAAAERLHVHPHTVTYRLGRVEELTRLSLSSPHDRLQLLLGLRAAKLLGNSFVPATKSPAGDSGAAPGEGVPGAG